MSSYSPQQPEDLRDFYHRYLRVVGSHDLDRLDGYVHETVTFNGVPITRDDLIGGLRANITAVPDMAWQIDELVVEGNKIAARVVITGTPVQEWLGLTPTGAAVAFAETAFYEFDQGRFKSFRTLMDLDSLRSQLLPDGSEGVIR